MAASRSVHNSHLQILAEAGYLGLALWLMMIALVSLEAYSKCGEWHSTGSAFSPEGDVTQVRSALPTQRRRGVLSSTASRSLSRPLIVTFCVGGTFYELAHTEFVWLGDDPDRRPRASGQRASPARMREDRSHWRPVGEVAETESLTSGPFSTPGWWQRP